MKKLLLPLAAAIIAVCGQVCAADAAPLGAAAIPAGESVKAGDARLPEGFGHIEMNVDGLDREALVYAPKSAFSTNSPLVFVFHGHGGTARQMARRVAFDRAWPEAISVYMQGLNTPGALTDPEGKRAGWQHGTGVLKDRDLKFFDAMLVTLKHDYKVDDHRIYATGHSNGGGFTYLLWETRPELFAAFAPMAAASKNAAALKPKPALHVAGENDPLVKFEWQKMTMDAVKKVNDCDAEGKLWDTNCTLYPSKAGAPLVAFIHPGGHEIPAGAPAAVVKFFKQHSAAERSPAKLE